MDKQQFDAMFNSVPDEGETDRVNYGILLGDLREWMVKISMVGQWLKETTTNWDEYEDITLEVVHESLVALSKYFDNGLSNLYEMIQQSALYLYGEKFTMESFRNVADEFFDDEEEED